MVIGQLCLCIHCDREFMLYTVIDVISACIGDDDDVSRFLFVSDAEYAGFVYDSLSKVYGQMSFGLRHC